MSKIIIALVAFALTACTVDVHEHELTPQEVGSIVLESCGQFRGNSGYSVFFDTRNGQQIAILSRVDFLNLTHDLQELKQWAYCATGQ